MTGSLDDSTRPASGGVDPDDAATTIARRRAGVDVGDDGSTVVARRESRRRQDRVHPDQAPSARAGVQVPGRGIRVAAAPDSMPAPMPVRVAAPVVVARSAPVARAPQDVVDTAAAEESRRRRSRRTAAAVVLTASALAVGASAALVVLLTVG